MAFHGSQKDQNRGTNESTKLAIVIMVDSYNWDYHDLVLRLSKIMGIK